MVVATAACTSSDPSTDEAVDPSTEQSVSSDGGSPVPVLMAGAASRSVMPTVAGERAYLDEAPGWAEDGDAEDPGVFVAAWDQGTVDVGNGADDGSWVHDDLRATALALERGDERTVIVSTDTYMHFAVDADAVAERARRELPEAWAEASILVSATHDHHGPDTAFSVNDDWYDLLADEVAAATADAVAALEPAQVGVAHGEHRFGVNDTRDPVVLDPRLNVLAVDAVDGGDPIATVVQWASHPETTLGWEPPAEAAGLDEACPAKGWEGDDCTAEGRYFTADYPGVLRARLDGSGGEVVYLNGALGSQVGPGQAPVWRVTPEHPVGDGWSVPDGAEPVASCPDDGDAEFLCRSFAKTDAIGTQLAVAVRDLRDGADPIEVSSLRVRTEEFLTRLTNIGFRLLLAEGDLGWQDAELFTCEGAPSAGDCRSDGGEVVDDPVLTPFVDSQIRAGDVVQTRVTHLDLGDVGFLFLPGELPPELVTGVPADFDADTGSYYRVPALHAEGGAYDFPGYLLSLVDEDVTFTVGLGTDELGYAVPVSDYRLRCLDLVLPAGSTCADLFARGVIGGADWIAGETCQAVTDDSARLEELGADGPAVAALCRYGQALGRELGEPTDHYEETNAAGWDLVEDLWAAATRLFDAAGDGRVNPELTATDVSPLAATR